MPDPDTQVKIDSLIAKAVAAERARCAAIARRIAGPEPHQNADYRERGYHEGATDSAEAIEREP